MTYRSVERLRRMLNGGDFVAALGMDSDVTLAPAASVCPDEDGRSSVVTSHRILETWRPAIDHGSRMRLYLVDLPEGSSVRILGIAIVAPRPRFESVVEAAVPVVDSIEFDAR